MPMLLHDDFRTLEARVKAIHQLTDPSLVEFVPPFCPRKDCKNTYDPAPDFWRPAGFHRNNAKDIDVPRFFCLGCRRSFSVQTFRIDYCDQKPQLNAQLFDRRIQSGGIRETARRLPISRRGLVQKMRKIERQLRLLHENMLGPFRGDAEFSFDELVTHERDRVTGPLTLPILVETQSHFVVDALSRPMAPMQRNSPRRKARIARHEAVHGRRRSEERMAVTQVLRTLEPHVARQRLLVFRTDQKALYPGVLKEVFGVDRVLHAQFSGKPCKAPKSPLFQINLAAAMVRDLEPRLRRRSWLAAKSSFWLNHSLASFVIYRNCVRKRLNADDKGTCPASLLGFLPRALTIEECVRWRQDFGSRSLHPTGLTGSRLWKRA